MNKWRNDRLKLMELKNKSIKLTKKLAYYAIKCRRNNSYNYPGRIMYNRTLDQLLKVSRKIEYYNEVLK